MKPDVAAWSSRWWSALRPLLPVLAMLAAAPSRAGCELQQIEIPVRIENHRPIATLSLNGVEMRMLLDSGAFFSMLSDAAATQLQLSRRNLPAGFWVEGHTGRVDAKLTRVDKVGLIGMELRNMEFLVGGNEIGAGIQGVLGRNILSVADTEYDLAHGAVRLSLPQGDCAKTNFAHWAGQAPVVEVPLEERPWRGDTAVRVTVRINGKPTSAILDTGAPRTLLTLRAARRAGLQDGDLTLVGRTAGAGAGWARSWTGRVSVFELGGEKITDNQLYIDDVDDSDQSMLIGLDYFLSHRIYVSRLQRKLYVTWNGTPPFALGDNSPGRFDARYAAQPQALAPDDADALARRGAAALAAGQHQRALEDLNRACELAPDVADHFDTRSQVHLAMGQTRLALADLDRALQLMPAHAEARLRRAGVHAALGDRSSVRADLTPLDAALPPASHLRAGMARIYARLDQAPQALKQFDLWVDHHPNDAKLSRILNDRCWLRARLNIDVPLALQDCRRAVEADDGWAVSRDSLGWTYLRLGDAAQAKKAFDAAIGLEQRPFSLYGRGLARLQQKDEPGSAADLAAARQLNPAIDEEVLRAGFEFAAPAARASTPRH